MDELLAERANDVESHPSSAAPRRSLASHALAVAAVVSLSAIGFVMMTASQAPAAGQIVEFESSSGDFLEPVGGDGVGGRIKYETAGGPVSVRNGGAVPLGDDLQLEVSVSPYPPTSFDLDIDLRLMSLTGEPIEGAEVKAVWDMVVMGHGPFETRFIGAGDGHYAASFDFFMFGPWRLITSVALPGLPEETITLLIYTWPE